MFGGNFDQNYLKHLNDLIQGMGTLTQIWTITYQSFREQKMSNEEAMIHTQALMSTMMKAMFNVQKE